VGLVKFKEVRGTILSKALSAEGAAAADPTEVGSPPGIGGTLERLASAAGGVVPPAATEDSSFPPHPTWQIPAATKEIQSDRFIFSIPFVKDGGKLNASEPMAAESMQRSLSESRPQVPRERRAGQEQ
jgi:hypothetical protein